jgi:hypothetical protein
LHGIISGRYEMYIGEIPNRYEVLGVFLAGKSMVGRKSCICNIYRAA